MIEERSYILFEYTCSYTCISYKCLFHCNVRNMDVKQGSAQLKDELVKSDHFAFLLLSVLHYLYPPEKGISGPVDFALGQKSTVRLYLCFPVFSVSLFSVVFLGDRFPTASTQWYEMTSLHLGSIHVPVHFMISGLLGTTRITSSNFDLSLTPLSCDHYYLIQLKTTDQYLVTESVRVCVCVCVCVWWLCTQASQCASMRVLV